MKICAVIITYFPNINVVLDVISRIRGQVNEILIVDNTPSRIDIDDPYIGFPVIYNGRNVGIAKAHNIGISWVKKHNFDYILLLDQDSIPDINMVYNLLCAYNKLQQSGVKVGAVGPQFIYSDFGNKNAFINFSWVKTEKTYCECLGDQVIRADFLISSGSLISLQTINHVGVMDDRLFIDHVDTEWCCRANSKGYSSFGVCTATMRHSLGDGGYRIWLGRWRFLPKHPPLRQYYMFRNSVLLYGYKHMPFKWITGDIIKLAYMFILYMFVSDLRYVRISLMVKGLWHGIIGRSGSIEDACRNAND